MVVEEVERELGGEEEQGADEGWDVEGEELDVATAGKAGHWE